MELIKKICPIIPVFSGDDDLVVDILKAGGVGSIATSSNLIPQGWKLLVNYCLNKKWNDAEALLKKFLPLIQALFLETNPQCVKFALSWLQKCKPVLRAPMTLPDLLTQKEIKKTILSLIMPQYKKNSLANTP